jgi:hypothetical protein
MKDDIGAEMGDHRGFDSKSHVKVSRRHFDHAIHCEGIRDDDRVDGNSKRDSGW